MDILFLLVPVSVMLALGVIGLLAWAVWSGQFEDVEKEAERILMDDKKSGKEPESRLEDKPGKPPSHEQS